jgi:hypothetical protein
MVAALTLQITERRLQCFNCNQIVLAGLGAFVCSAPKSSGVFILVQSAAGFQRAKWRKWRMSILSDAGLVRAYQLDANQCNIVPHVVNKILGRFFF